MYKVLLNLWDEDKKKGDYPPTDFKNVLSWYKPQELNCDYGSIQELIEIYLKAQKTVDVRKYKDENNPKIKFIL